MKSIRFGYSTNPKVVLVQGTESIQDLCNQHQVSIDSSIVNHNGMPIAAGFLSSALNDINVADGDSIIIVTKTNAA